MRSYGFLSRVLVVIVAVVVGSSTCLVAAQKAKQQKHARHLLYTKPDPSSTGGIKGKISYPSMPIEQILAIPPDEPRLVYEGKRDGTSFSFSGLPMGKYDLVVIYDNAFYEGLRLHREDDTLSYEDKSKIDMSIMKSEPFFNVKTIHRLEGTTGRGNMCRAICTYLRDKLSEDYSGMKMYRRTFKILILKDVGPGWQIVRSRDLYPLNIDLENKAPAHFHCDAISGIRVSDYVKDLGEITLQ